MRITVPSFDLTNARVVELLDKARAAVTMAEGTYYQRLARKASEKGA